MKLQIRANVPEDNEQSAARYVNGLSFHMQDELALIKLHTVDEAYQYVLRAKEKLNQGKGKSYSQRGEKNPSRNTCIEGLG